MMASLSTWAHDGDHNYTNGICTIADCTDKYQPAELADGKFLLKNAGNIEWMGVKIANGEQYDGKNYNQATYEMQNDIDFTGVEHTPIGPNAQKKFNGVFDGKGHKISNMHVEAANAGMFCWLRGGTTIKNLTLDETCSFHGTDRSGSFGCVTQVRGGGDVNLINCVNYASVTTDNKIASGLIAACNWENDDEPSVNIINCVNAGNVTCTGGDNTVAFFGWSKSAGGTRITIINSYNTGTLSSVDGVRDLVRASNMDNVTITNSYDLNATSGQQGYKAWNTNTPLASGELCYTLNENVEERAYTFKQTLNVDEMPLPLESGDIVYQAGTVNCKGEAVGGVTYNNVSGETIHLPHDFATSGICNVCADFEAPELVDGYYELCNAGNVEWFGKQVAAGKLNINGKLMNDIDFLGQINLHSPIGPNTGNKYNGTFDGQGFRIKNMIIDMPETDNVGFFGFLRGNAENTTIKNLIIDSSCSISARNRVGAIAGSSQNNGTLITIENVVNEANVTASGQDAAAIVGGVEGNNPKWYIHNVVNTGTITSTHEFPYAGALFCYQNNGETVVENFLNLGTVNGHRGGNMGRVWGTLTNVFDLSETDPEESVDGENRGMDSDLTTEDVDNGKVAYIMDFKQLLGSDEYPSPLNTDVVYGVEGHTAYYNKVDGAAVASAVVINDNCENFALPTDVTSFTAPAVAYSREIAADVNIVCLPFALTSAQLPENAKIYTLGEIKGDKISVTEVTNVEGGVPCIVQFPEGFAGTWDITINETTSLAVSPVNEGMLKGSYATETIGTGAYSLNGSAFAKVAESDTVKPFRAYLEAEAADQLTIDFSATTGIESTSISNNAIEVYNLQGNKITLQKGINIVKMANGEAKKIIVK